MKSQKTERIAGFDEAGRGPLAGPVVAACVILPEQYHLEGLNDSKKLTEKQRLQLFDAITTQAVDWAIAEASVQEIDQINILQASLLAMQRAYAQLKVKPDRALIDGNKSPVLNCPTEAIIQGDSLIPAISAASILAKVRRDQLMMQLHEQFPLYQFDRHKGYPTALHLKNLKAHGISSVHRLSYAPVRKLMEPTQ